MAHKGTNSFCQHRYIHRKERLILVHFAPKNCRRCQILAEMEGKLYLCDEFAKK